MKSILEFRMSTYRLIAQLMIGILAIVSFESVYAQQPTKPRGPQWPPHGAIETISPDGKLTAHFGTEYPAVLYIKHFDTGEDVPIVKSKDISADWNVVGGLSFSPDSERIVFEAGPARPFSGSIYEVNADGSGLKVLSIDKQRTPDPEDHTGEKLQDIASGNPVFSTDSKEISVEIVTNNGHRDESGRIDVTQGRSYVGLLTTDKVNQTPALLTEGKPLFWSTDGQSIYYMDKQHILKRVFTATKVNQPVADLSNITILGKVPSRNAIFTLKRGEQAVSVMELTNTTPSKDLQELADSIQLKDSQGRSLSNIVSAGPGHLSLNYDLRLPSHDVGVESHKSQLIRMQ